MAIYKKKAKKIRKRRALCCFAHQQGGRGGTKVAEYLLRCKEQVNAASVKLANHILASFTSV